MSIVIDALATPAERLDSWIEREGFRGWDPYDALNSPLFRFLTFGHRRPGQLWVQVLKHSPLNFRPLFRISKSYNPKGLGLFLASYLRKYELTGNRRYLQNACLFSNWLIEHASSGYSGACWGYNFDWPNRGFLAPAGTPTIVNTAFIALAFLDLAVRVGREDALLPRLHRDPLVVAQSACDFVLNDLHQVSGASDEFCFSYTPLDRRCIHNANLLGAWLLSSVYSHTRQCHLADAAISAMHFTLRRQLSNGSWFYGEAPNDHWIDNFHTGFVLVALKCTAASLGSNAFDDSIAKGYEFWKSHFFLSDGTPKYYPDRVYPIDIHSVAQACLTFLEFADCDPIARDLAERTAWWGIEHMQDPKGYFHYQLHHRYRIRIPYMRWSQAWMQRALVELMYRRRV